MNLAELFHECNLAGVRLANVGGRLELRGPTIPATVKAGAVEHKATLLSLLPPLPEPTPSAAPDPDAQDPDAQDLAEERDAIVTEAEGRVPAEALSHALAKWDAIVAVNTTRFGPFCIYHYHRLAWRSIHDVEVCAECHPPAHSGLVREWVWQPDAPGIKALMQLVESSHDPATVLDKVESTGVESSAWPRNEPS